MSETTLKDRQKRFESLNLVSFTHRSPDGKIDLEVVGRTLDLSIGGILLEISPEIPSENTEVEVTLGIRDNVIQATGEIVHQRELENGHFGLGISFKNISDENIKTLLEFLEETGD